jgi:diaminopimelate decarboxylase
LKISGEIRSVRIQGQEGNDIHIHNNFKKTEELVASIESLLAEAIHR